ncbi:hypothetical protein [Desulfurococcus amylolyticus]|uniref:hypothetical protein n=1 Tax=Desulfurococcus amylolyticus TaxID=94694 RepID=UPI0023F04548|nr:hypothetical protein [Desulfurococcus amylolyticus]
MGRPRAPLHTLVKPSASSNSRSIQVYKFLDAGSPWTGSLTRVYVFEGKIVKSSAKHPVYPSREHREKLSKLPGKNKK